MMEKNDNQNIKDLNPTYLSSQVSELLLSRHYSLLVNVEQGQTLTTFVCVYDYVALCFAWCSWAPARFLIINTKHYFSFCAFFWQNEVNNEHFVTKWLQITTFC